MKNLFAAFVVMGMLAACIHLASQTESPPKPKVELKPHRKVKAGITPGETMITVQNEDEADWPPLQIYLNGSPPFTYHLTIPALNKGEVLEIPLRKFAKDDGQRFDPAAYKVVEVWIGGNGEIDYVKYGL